MGTRAFRSSVVMYRRDNETSLSRLPPSSPTSLGKAIPGARSSFRVSSVGRPFRVFGDLIRFPSSSRLLKNRWRWKEVRMPVRLRRNPRCQRPLLVSTNISSSGDSRKGRSRRPLRTAMASGIRLFETDVVGKDSTTLICVGPPPIATVAAARKIRESLRPNRRRLPRKHLGWASSLE